MNFQNKNDVIVMLLAVLLCAGCFSTIVPPPVKPIAASYDNGERNSGFYGFVTNNGVAYGIISPHARDRYNALIATYGKKFSPRIKEDYGIIDNNTNYLITLEGLSDFAIMNQWRKNGQ